MSYFIYIGIIVRLFLLKASGNTLDFRAKYSHHSLPDFMIYYRHQATIMAVIVYIRNHRPQYNKACSGQSNNTTAFMMMISTWHFSISELYMEFFGCSSAIAFQKWFSFSPHILFNYAKTLFVLY